MTQFNLRIVFRYVNIFGLELIGWIWFGWDLIGWDLMGIVRGLELNGSLIPHSLQILYSPF